MAYTGGWDYAGPEDLAAYASRPPRPGLGADPSTVAPADPSDPFAVGERSPEWWISTGRKALELWRRLSSLWGRGPWGHTGYDPDAAANPCPGTPDFNRVHRAVQRMPDDDIGWLVYDVLLPGNKDKGPRSRRDLADAGTLPIWTKAVMGGKDCAYSDPVVGNAIRARFLELVSQYGGRGPDVLPPGASELLGEIPGWVKGIAAGLAVKLLLSMGD